MATFKSLKGKVFKEELIDGELWRTSKKVKVQSDGVNIYIVDNEMAQPLWEWMTKYNWQYLNIKNKVVDDIEI
jgi:hypothetical protein